MPPTGIVAAEAGAADTARAAAAAAHRVVRRAARCLRNDIDFKFFLLGNRAGVGR
jgi:hypothetical protein